MSQQSLQIAMQNVGLECSNMVSDGKLHRFDVPGDRPKSGNGWYVYYDGEIQAAAFGSWKTEAKHKWCSHSQEDFTPEQKAAYKKQMEAARRQREAEQAKVEAECREWCAKAWAAAPPAHDDHPYLQRKGVKSHGLRIYKGSLMVPVRALVGGALVGVQFIYPDGTKKFKSGTAKAGAMHMIGKPIDNTLIICEGYATGASIHMATGHAVLVAFDAGNLKPVAEAARLKQPKWALIIAADDDRWAKEEQPDGSVVYHEVPCTLKGLKRENAGITKATEAAKSVGGTLVRPQFTSLDTHPTDFNDLHALSGDKAVRWCVFPPPEAPYNPCLDDEPVSVPEEMYDAEFSPNPLNGAPFICLGYNHGEYYYLPRGAPQVKILKAPEHSKPNLMSLAPLQYWERDFPSKTGFDQDAALNKLLRVNEGIGIYDASRIRGRGAWEDNGRSVLHMGNVLIVDGVEHEIGDIKTRYLYEAAIPMEFGTGSNALSNREAIRLEELCKMLSWEKPISGTLLAGWCVVSSICGALGWRPHIHITGGAGCGKSWIVDNIVRPVAGPGALVVQGATTEAGIRQSLGNDARPVIYDEAEGEDQNAQKRMQGILELARQASSETGGSIYKGTTGGRAQSFRIRSSFCFSSIGVSATQQADQSRISVLGLKSTHDGGKLFAKILDVWREVVTEEFCRALRARIIRLIPVIRRNAAIFSQVVSAHLGSKRTGDQLGAILAGAYALRSVNEIDPAVAEKFVKEQDWSEHQLEVEQSDEQRCLSIILESLVRIPTSPPEEKSIAELIQVMAGQVIIDDSDPAQKTLKRHGLKAVDGGFLIANKHAELAKKLEKTPWANNWARILARLPGAIKREQVWFSGAASRAVMLPISYVKGE